MRTTIRIRGMSCGHCVRAVETALKEVTGVTEARVSVGEAVVSTDGEPDERALRAAIEDAGFEVA
jgi:copper chaperone CopZ